MMDLEKINVTVNNAAVVYDSIVTTLDYVKHNREELTKDGNWPSSRRLLKLNVWAASQCRDAEGYLGEKARELLALIEEIEDWYNGR